MASTEVLNHSQEEWTGIIDEVYKNLPSQYPVYPCPEPGSTEFAQLFDHTLLKLDANAPQIETLCEEARQYGFKVEGDPFFCAPFNGMHVPPTSHPSAPSERVYLDMKPRRSYAFESSCDLQHGCLPLI